MIKLRVGDIVGHVGSAGSVGRVVASSVSGHPLVRWIYGRLKTGQILSCIASSVESELILESEKRYQEVECSPCVP